MFRKCEIADSKLPSESLRKISRGAVIALLGTFLGLLMQFLTRIILARYGTQAEYGTFSLSLIVFNVCTVLAWIGLYEGTARYIAYLRGRGRFWNIRQVIRDAIVIPLISSLIVGFILFVAADFVATIIFHIEQLTVPFRVLSCGLPVITLINNACGIYRGYDRVGPQVLFQTVIVNTLFFVMSFIVVFFRLSFSIVFYVYVFSMIVSLVILVGYSLRHAKDVQPERQSPERKDSLRRDLLLFSLPIMGTALLYSLMTSIDTLLLGYFATADQVGIYNASYTIAIMLTVFLGAFQMIFLPVVTGLFSREMVSEVGRVYFVTSKWLICLTFPLFLILMLFPEAVLGLLFGEGYIVGTWALRILATGYMVSNAFGLAAGVLVAKGKTKLHLLSAGISAAANALISYILIPQIGILGAAIAASVSFSALYIIDWIFVRRIVDLNYFRFSLFKPLTFAFVILAVFYAAFKYLFVVPGWTLPIILILYIIVYIALMILTRSFEEDDLAVIGDILRTLGLHTLAVDKIMRKMTRIGSHKGDR